MKSSKLTQLALAGAFAGAAALTGCNTTSGGNSDVSFATAANLSEFQAACTEAEGTYSTANGQNSCVGYAFVSGSAMAHDCMGHAQEGFEANCML